ncbi:Gag protein [Danaus plexippus plexippus]|uniref:Gag protein n=1 Tax=Danaus plexippus plexippus TaxID=278856 RepID=A0A212EU37_DANPL|nr:Gag protein [Danaus plexippus plexippus]
MTPFCFSLFMLIKIMRAFAERGNQRKSLSAGVEDTAEETQVSKPSEGITRTELASIMDRFQRELSEQFGRILSARLEGLEVDGRLLPAVSHRPALASETQKRSHKQVDKPTTLAPPANMPKEARAKKGAKTKAVATDSGRAAEQAAGPSQQEPPVVLEGWTTVVKRTKSKKSAPAPAAPKAPKKKPSLPKQPKTLAVVVTLKPEAVAEGITYKDAIAKAKQSVNLEELGIGSTKFRTGITGARIIELPKEVSAAQADSLASRIGQALGDAAKVTRPRKIANVRISGLDDSVTPEEIRKALAEKTGVSPDDFKVGLITHGYTGIGSTITACPIETVPKLAEAGRLCVGWSAASIRVLEQRPMRCHRCYGIGHPQQLCPSNKDRSGLCFRSLAAGEEGHAYIYLKTVQPHFAARCAKTGAWHRVTEWGEPTVTPLRSKAAPYNGDQPSTLRPRRLPL